MLSRLIFLRLVAILAESFLLVELWQFFFLYDIEAVAMAEEGNDSDEEHTMRGANEIQDYDLNLPSMHSVSPTKFSTP